MSAVIRAENVSKAYQIGEFSTGSLTQDIERWWGKMRGKEDIFSKVGEINDRSVKGIGNLVWSLKDLNFEIEQGEAVGIIGRNGAGKSTLLKILSRVTTPTTGSVKVKGRISSLLEVGTGFHPELTGRENIYLNGAILGMRKKEIKDKFDEIVDFSGVERYIDTPVKRYSSGMYVRLAFAVAANLESEILIIDEVLAVGDAEFQEKCLGKMGDVSKNQGRTVLYVSHQMGTILQLCNRAIMLDKGQVILDGNTNKVVEQYNNYYKSKEAIYVNEESSSEDLFIRSAIIYNEANAVEGIFKHNERIEVRVKCCVNNWVRGAEVRMILRDNRNINVFTTDIELNNVNPNTRQFTAVFKIPANLIRPNEYYATLALLVPNQYHIEIMENILFFTVIDAGSKYAQSEGIDYGPIFSPCKTDIIDIIQ
jgi:lipopolysaccharide transport system ATP-binding protein